MVKLQQAAPVGLAVGPAADLVEVFGAVGELVGAPGEQKNILGRPQFEQPVVDVRHAEDDDAPAGLPDLAAEVVLDLVGRDGFQARLHDGVAGGHLGARPAGHGSGSVRAADGL